MPASWGPPGRRGRLYGAVGVEFSDLEPRERPGPLHERQAAYSNLGNAYDPLESLADAKASHSGAMGARSPKWGPARAAGVLLVLALALGPRAARGLGARGAWGPGAHAIAADSGARARRVRPPLPAAVAVDADRADDAVFVSGTLPTDADGQPVSGGAGGAVRGRSAARDERRGRAASASSSSTAFSAFLVHRAPASQHPIGPCT